MSYLGGTHTHNTVKDFLSHHNTLKAALNSNLKRFAPDHLRNHLNNREEYLLFKQVRKTLTFWYTKCQNLHKYLLTLGPITGHPTTSLLTELHQALKCIKSTETLLNTTNNSFLIAKAYRTVVLTYKNLSDGHLRWEIQSQNVTHSTLTSSSYLLNKRISVSNYNTYWADTEDASGTNSRSSRSIETQTENTVQSVNTDGIITAKYIQCSSAEVQTDNPGTHEVGSSASESWYELRPDSKRLVDSYMRLHYKVLVLEDDIGDEGCMIKLLPYPK